MYGDALQGVQNVTKGAAYLISTIYEVINVIIHTAVMKRTQIANPGREKGAPVKEPWRKQALLIRLQLLVAPSRPSVNKMHHRSRTMCLSA